MLDYGEYITGLDHYQGDDGDGYHNGYDQLESDWLTYYKVGKGIVRKVKREDREDFLHDLFLAFARVKASYDAKGKELTEGGLVRIAQYEVATYWRKCYHHNNGIDCGSCSKAQRAKCRPKDLYSKCPKAVRIESLNKLIGDGEGGEVELYQMLADDSQVDLAARLDAKLTLDGYPQRFVQIAYKKYAGYPLNTSELNYYYREQKRLKKLWFR